MMSEKNTTGHSTQYLCPFLELFSEQRTIPKTTTGTESNSQSNSQSNYQSNYQKEDPFMDVESWSAVLDNLLSLPRLFLNQT